MKKLKSILSFVFALGIMCLGFSFASNNYSNVNAFAYSSQIVLENSTFDMGGGTISNAIGDNGGAVYVGDGATFTMTGGKIKNCSATNGGAVYVANGGTFVFDGGTIENCSADLGYAIYVQAGGTLNYENNADGFSGCGEDQNLHIYAEEGATVIGAGTPIYIYVDDSNVPAKTITVPMGETTYTINEAEMPLDYENCCGYFYDAKLSQCTNGVVDLTRVKSVSTFTKRTANEESNTINLYTRTANPDNFIFTENTTTGTYDIKAKDTTISGDIVLPKEYNNVQTSIVVGTTYNTGAFYNCISVTSITFQDGLQEISNYAFYNLSSLTGELIIPDSVTSIGDGAFSVCGGLTGELIIPGNVINIGDGAFSDCYFTGSLIIPDSVITIGSDAFFDCAGFSGQLIIGNGVEYIGDYAFYDNSLELELILGNNIKTIGECAFQANYFTGNLNLPEGLTSLGYRAFAECPNLTGDLTIPSTLVNMADGVFCECSGFDGTLTIKNGVTNIAPSVFDGCSGLTGSLIIPNSVTSIGGYAFNGCSGFTGSLIIPNSVTDIGNYAFSGCSGFNGGLTLGNSLESIGNYAFSSCSGITGGLTIPNSVKSIGQSAFGLCRKFTGSLIIPDSVTTMGDRAFAYCMGITGLTIGKGITSIGNSMFEECRGLTGNLIIQNNVQSIGTKAFAYCNKLTGVYLPSSVSTINVTRATDSPFNNCSSSLVIYTDVTNASSKPSGWGTYWNYYDSSNQLQVVYGCSLDSEGNIVTPTTINFYVDGTYHSSITKAGTSYAVQESEMPLQYEDCCGYFLNEELTKTIKNDVVDLSNGDVNLYTRTASDPDAYFTFTENTTTGTFDIKAINTEISGDIVLPKEYNNVQTSIGNSAFYSCSGLTSVIIPDSVTSIGDAVFASCSGLTSVIIPDSVTSIGDAVFASCSGLTSVTIIGNQLKIGENAFYSCSGLTSVTIGDGVTTIGNYAFTACSGLTSVTIGDDVTTIGKYAFSSCNGLTSVIIPDGVTSIGYQAFSSCSRLTSVYIPSSVTTISASTYSNAPFRYCSSSLVIYTDVANASSVPSGWGTYWNYYGSGTLTVNYGYTLEQYKSAVGLTFAPSVGREAQKDEDIEISQNMLLQCLTETTVDAIIEKRECVVLPKKQTKIA